MEQSKDLFFTKYNSEKKIWGLLFLIQNGNSLLSPDLDHHLSKWKNTCLRHCATLESREHSFLAYLYGKIIEANF